jgi:hypothetical protein
MSFYAEAISRLRPGAQWGLSPADQLIVNEAGHVTNLSWHENNSLSPPTADEIRATAIECEQDYVSKDYQRKRDMEYPPLADLADALYWQGKGDLSKMTEYMSKIDAIKSKYPKP